MMNEANVDAAFLESIVYRFGVNRRLAEGALNQLSDDDFFWEPAEDVNSIAVIIQHLHGNMLSRWTDFLTTDGEKSTRDRDGEFEPSDSLTRADLMRKWNEGWDCFQATLDSLNPDDVLKTIEIRGQGLTVLDALQRQAFHYGYHIGQIVQLAKCRRGKNWNTLSVAKGQSKQYAPTRRD